MTTLSFIRTSPVLTCVFVYDSCDERRESKRKKKGTRDLGHEIHKLGVLKLRIGILFQHISYLSCSPLKRRCVLSFNTLLRSCRCRDIRLCRGPLYLCSSANSVFIIIEFAYHTFFRLRHRPTRSARTLRTTGGGRTIPPFIGIIMGRDIIAICC